MRSALRLLALFLAAATPLELPAESPATPEPLTTEFAYEAIVEIGACVDIGATPHGARRTIPITGGTFEGPAIKGVVLPGGADWQTDRPDGTTELNALYSMRCDDGTVIVVHNSGIASGGYLRTTTRFDAPAGPHDWLNKAQFVGSVSAGPRPGTVTIRIFRVL
jgi:hypothetical protein